MDHRTAYDRLKQICREERERQQQPLAYMPELPSMQTPNLSPIRDEPMNQIMIRRDEHEPIPAWLATAGLAVGLLCLWVLCAWACG